MYQDNMPGQMGGAAPLADISVLSKSTSNDFKKFAIYNIINAASYGDFEKFKNSVDAFEIFMIDVFKHPESICPIYDKNNSDLDDYEMCKYHTILKRKKSPWLKDYGNKWMSMPHLVREYTFQKFEALWFIYQDSLPMNIAGKIAYIREKKVRMEKIKEQGGNPEDVHLEDPTPEGIVDDNEFEEEFDSRPIKEEYVKKSADEKRRKQVKEYSKSRGGIAFDIE